jgi:2,5-furandicarboxylate decarboxylase 1
VSQDLRTFLDSIDRSGQLLRVAKEVDPKTEMAALAWQVPAEKAALFEKLKGFPGWRSCVGMVDTRERVAGVLKVPVERLLEEYARLLDLKPTKCSVVNDGPVKEIILKGDDADLSALPVMRYCQRDAGPYLTFSELITVNPDTGFYNAAILRMQIKGKRKTSTYMLRGRHSWENYLKYEARNEAMPVAIVIGHHPAFHMIGSWSGPYDADEFELVGTLLGEPLRLVQAETIDLKVPADAEVIIEGEILPKYREEEGPFAEFTSYYCAAGKEPVINVKAITRRKDPIYEFSAQWYRAHACLGIEHYLYNRIKEVEGHIELHDVRIYSEVDSYMVVIQFTPHYEGQAKNVLLAALSGTTLHPKIAVAVDEDVDVSSLADIWWAVANRTHPKRDVFIVDGTRNHPFDLKLPLAQDTDILQRVGSKMGIDATKPPTSKPDIRKAFDRARPVGWQKVKLADYLGPKT